MFSPGAQILKDRPRTHFGTKQDKKDDNEIETFGRRWPIKLIL